MYLMTGSLLSSWLYQFRDFEKLGDKADEYRMAATESFVRTLHREESKDTAAIQRGIDFENLVFGITMAMTVHNDTLLASYESNKWYEAAFMIADTIKGGVWQYAEYKEVVIADTPFLLYGRLDVLKAGTIYDIKFSGIYEVGKYYDSPQHHMYMELVPEARQFIYLVSNGQQVWTETYYRDEIKPISVYVEQFVSYLKAHGLFDVYTEYWKAKDR